VRNPPREISFGWSASSRERNPTSTRVEGEGEVIFKEEEGQVWEGWKVEMVTVWEIVS